LNGIAQLSVVLPQGVNVVSVAYAGDAANLPSTSQSVSFAVNAVAAASISLIANANSAPANSSLLLTA
jgi:hypothetical protein